MNRINNPEQGWCAYSNWAKLLMKSCRRHQKNQIGLLTWDPKQRSEIDTTKAFRFEWESKSAQRNRKQTTLQ